MVKRSTVQSILTKSSSERSASRTIARSKSALIVRPAWIGTTVRAFRVWMDQDEMATLLPVFNESGPFESPDHLPRSQRRELRHGSGGNRYSTLKETSFLGCRLAMRRQALEIQFDRFRDIALRLFQGLALSVTTGKNRDECYIATFRNLLRTRSTKESWWSCGPSPLF